MYDQVAPSGSPAFARYRLAPALFEEQLRYLREAGFRGVTLDEWREARQRWEPLTGRAVMLTFDDGYKDFEHYAWPLLRKYDFSALVFVVADRIGATNSWDEPDEPLALLGWEEIRRLQDEGVVFGSHSATHPFLTALSPADVAREAARSRAILTRGLGRPVTAFAYPHGAEDEAIQHLVGACGYVYGLSCRPGPSRLGDPLLALPRVEITGSDTLADFIAKLGE
jgi:peptidoglycan/xylan/chitin deacetylase (PgdA/CDA1 family)